MNRPQVACLSLIALFLLACGGEDIPTRQRHPGPDWMKKAKLAGLPVYAGQPPAELHRALDALVDQHVDVVIADSSLSNYKTDAEFDGEMALLEQVAKAAHARGLKVVWYLTSLEIQTVDGRILPHSMFKDHPDWVQIGYDPQTKTFTKPNVFFGAQEDWVEPNDESAWLCPRGPYLDYFLERVKKIVRTGIDGIWADVPLFMDTGAKWACHCPTHKAHFKQVSGHDLPTKIDFADPVWRRWIKYRHEDLNEFLVKIKDAARSVTPTVEVLIEVFTVDYNDAMDKGLDGQFMGSVDGLAKAWEIDSVSNGRGMLNATHDDWIGKIALTKFAKGVDKGRPTWVFNYGNTEWDAMMVMAVAFAAQTNPYETKTPNMATSVGVEFRKRMFSWADRHIDQLYDASSAARVGILYSSHSRDYTDHKYGFAMFSDTHPPTIDLVDPKSGAPLGKRGPDPEWWSNERRDSVQELEYLGEYRGFVKVLSHLHVPFAIEGLQQLQVAHVQRYETLIAPALSALSNAQAKLLRDYVEQGGNLIITGPLPSGKDEVGTERPRLALAELLGFDRANVPALDRVRSRHFGQGTVHYSSSLLARRYLRSDDQLALQELARLIASSTGSALRTDAAKHVYFDLYHYQPGPEALAKGHAEELVLHAINLVGYDGKSDAPKATPQKPSVTLALPVDRKARRVLLSSPEEGKQDRELTFDNQQPGLVRFELPVDYYALVRVELAPESFAARLTVDVDWPKKGAAAPYLAAFVRVSGDGLAGARSRPLGWGESSVVFDNLPPGAKRVQVSTIVDGGRSVGLATRTVTLAAGGQANVSVATGVSTAGPASVSGEIGDMIFLVNDTAGPLALDIGDPAQQQLAAGEVASLRLSKAGSVSYKLGSIAGSASAIQPSGSPFVPQVDKLSHDRGFSGHSVVFGGSGFGFGGGRVLWGDEPCAVTYWSDNKVTAMLPDGATPQTKDLTLIVGGAHSQGFPFTVEPSDFVPTAPMTATFSFVRDQMRAASGGVFTNYKDRVDPPDAAAVYPYGHHQTAEHMGLLLWTAAAMLDHKTFEESFQFVMGKMMSPNRDLVNWAIHKKDGQPMRQREDEKAPWLNSNAPLDDFRVLKGFVAGWMQWKDERYLAAALRLGRGLLETSVSKPADLPVYPDGVVAYAHNWPEESGMGVTDVAVIPIDYADLWTMRWLSERDARWSPVIAECIRMMKDAQHQGSKQFYNSYLQATKNFSGDFEFRDTKAGKESKLIQTLWIAIHLARVGERVEAQAFLDFLKQLYHKSCGEPFCSKFPCVSVLTHPMNKNCGTVTCRIPEYLHFNGSEIDYCQETYFQNTLGEGEARIYSQIVRLAYYLGGKENTDFADQLVQKHILTDQVTQQLIASDPALKAVPGVTKLIGAIGLAAAKDGDAEAWNNLEALVGLLAQHGSAVVIPVYPKQ